jgi:hypothetical protein
VPPEHETLLWLLTGPTRSRSGRQTPTQQPPKKPNTSLESGSFKGALLNFKVAILLGHPHHLSLTDQDLVLAEVKRVLHETTGGGRPFL